MNETHTVHHIQGGVIMAATWYVFKKVAVVRGSGFYVSRDITEYGGLFLVTI